MTWPAWPAQVGNCVLLSVWAVALLSCIQVNITPANVLGTSSAKLGKASTGVARNTRWAGVWRGQRLPGAGAGLAVDGSDAAHGLEPLGHGGEPLGMCPGSPIGLRKALWPWKAWKWNQTIIACDSRGLSQH